MNQHYPLTVHCSTIAKDFVKIQLGHLSFTSMGTPSCQCNANTRQQHWFFTVMPFYRIQAQNKARTHISMAIPHRAFLHPLMALIRSQISVQYFCVGNFVKDAEISPKIK